MGIGGQRHAPAALPPGKTRYASYRWLGGPMCRSGQVRKISPLTGIRCPDRPARSESLYRLSYSGPHEVVQNKIKYTRAIYLCFSYSKNKHSIAYNYVWLALSSEAVCFDKRHVNLETPVAKHFPDTLPPMCSHNSPQHFVPWLMASYSRANFCVRQAGTVLPVTSVPTCTTICRLLDWVRASRGTCSLFPYKRKANAITVNDIKPSRNRW